MKRRPAACAALALFLLLLLLPMGLMKKSSPITQKQTGRITGRVARWSIRDEGMQLSLVNCQIQAAEGSFEAERILVYLSRAADYPVGADLSLSGTIYPVETPTNPGQFDSSLYYGAKGISCTVFAEDTQILALHSSPLRERLLQLKKRFGEVYDAVLGEGDVGVIRAMVLGEKSELDSETKNLYQKNGISHLLAISGLHISLIGMGLYRILRRLTGYYLPSGIPTILLITAYGWMTGASVSALRAVIMCTLMVAADLVGRSYDMLTAMGVAAIVLLVPSPLNSRQSGFLLSFGAVLGIALLLPLWRLYRPKQGRLVQALSVSLSVLAVTFPVLLCAFSEYSPYSTLLNLLVIPLMSVLMAAAVFCGLTGLLSLGAARVLALPCRLILLFYRKMGELCLMLPGSVLTIGTPPRWKIVLYYSMLCMALCLLYREKRRKKYSRKPEEYRPGRGILVLSGALLAVPLLLICTRVHTELQITMLDVGQGDGIFIRSADGTTFLMDGGSTGVSSVGTYRILPYLKYEGVGRLDYLMISHMDSDHISSIEELLADSMTPGGIDIGTAVLPGINEKDEAYEEMEALLAEAGVEILYMKTGDVLASEELSLTCLWPSPSAHSDDRNELSLVLLAEYQDFDMLLTGDIGEETEKALLETGLLSQVEVLKTAHHGSRYSTSVEFLDVVCPTVSLISCSATNTYGHPSEETLARLADVGSIVFITKDCGAISVWTDGEKVRVRKYR